MMLKSCDGAERHQLKEVMVVQEEAISDASPATTSARKLTSSALTIIELDEETVVDGAI
jgi:hypothetical protein